MNSFYLVVFITGVALIFDYINGFHDAANSIATVVSTRVLTPGVAVVWAAVFNFLAAFLLGPGGGNGGRRFCQCPPGDAVGCAGRSGGGHPVGHLHLVSGAAHQFFPRPDRRLCRRRLR